MSQKPVSAAPTNVNAPGGKVRWIICSLLFFSVAVNYIDRNVVGILKGPLSEKLGWSDVDYGYITAAFNFAYAFGYLLGGRLVDRFGVKKALPWFVFLWSLAACAHGLCSLLDVQARVSFRYPWFDWTEKALVMATFAAPLTAFGFIGARLALGLTEGGNFPAAIKTVAEWFPVKERALATGWFNAGTNVGAILCPIAVRWMNDQWGWATTFYVTGSTGFLWLIAWAWLYETPEKHPKLSAEELAYIRADQKPAAAVVKVPWLKLLSYRAVWAYLIAGILAGPAWPFYGFFLPDFLRKNFALSFNAMAWWTSAFYVLAAVGGIAGGWMTARLMAQGWTVNKSRKLALLICALCVLPVCLAPFAGSAWLAVVIVGVAGSAHQGWSANLFSVVGDTMPKETISSVVGLGGFVSYLMAAVMSAVTGFIVQKTGSYVFVFAYYAGMYLVSLLAIQLLVPRLGRQTD